MTAAVFDFEAINRNMHGDDWWKNQQHAPYEGEKACDPTPYPVNPVPQGQPMPCTKAPTPTTPGPITGGMGKPASFEEMHQRKPDRFDMLVLLDKRIAEERERHIQALAELIEKKRSLSALIQHEEKHHVISYAKPDACERQAPLDDGPYQQSPSRSHRVGLLGADHADYAEDASKPIRHAR